MMLRVTCPSLLLALFVILPVFVLFAMSASAVADDYKPFRITDRQEPQNHWSSRLNIAVFAPIPSARVPTAIKEKVGFFPSVRTLYRTSCTSLSNQTPARTSRTFCTT